MKHLVAQRDARITQQENRQAQLTRHIQDLDQALQEHQREKEHLVAEKTEWVTKYRTLKKEASALKLDRFRKSIVNTIDVNAAARPIRALESEYENLNIPGPINDFDPELLESPTASKSHRASLTAYQDESSEDVTMASFPFDVTYDRVSHSAQSEFSPIPRYYNDLTKSPPPEKPANTNRLSDTIKMASGALRDGMHVRIMSSGHHRRDSDDGKHARVKDRGDVSYFTTDATQRNKARSKTMTAISVVDAFAVLYKDIRKHLSPEEFVEFAKLVSLFNASKATAEQTVKAVGKIVQDKTLTDRFEDLLGRALTQRNEEHSGRTRSV
ncbi:hypothetical protein BZG36_00478 [Bifiguratus adelaidae]|uniref:Uncharacterized protein n=1 Tax=Bifiguratus adelaidae TaxID=1938954 RepID=A0A261Y7R4_9FUNG|nr:hypothetical protein BZG36_00478 [Bifiguratus adelaidae]